MFPLACCPFGKAGGLFVPNWLIDQSPNVFMEPQTSQTSLRRRSCIMNLTFILRDGGMTGDDALHFYSNLQLPDHSHVCHLI